MYEIEVKAFKEMEGAAEKQEAIREAIEQMEKLERLVIERGGKTFKELHPTITTKEDDNYQTAAKEDVKEVYKLNIAFGNTTDVTDIRKKAYLEL